MNVDAEPMAQPDVVCNIGSERWPFEDNSVEAVEASHILEHLTTPEFFHCLKEMYRVCKNEAQVHVVVPHPRHDIFLGDPTHQRPILPGTLIMFSQGQIEKLRQKEIILTPFGKYLGVDFYLSPEIRYQFAEGIDPNAPDIAWQMKHLNNIVHAIEMTMTVRK